VKPLKMTVVFADNPLAGLPGQNDLTITISGEPDIPLGPGGRADSALMEQLLESPAFCAVIECMAHVAGLAAETVLMSMARGSQS
jgi:hypothetical protein